MTLSVGAMFLLSVFFADVDTASIPYFDPPESERTSRNYAIHGAGSIPRVRGEKVVTADEGKQILASSLILLVNREYSVVKTTLQQLVKDEIGIVEDHEDASVMTVRSSSEWPPWPPLGPRLETVIKHNGRSAAIQEYHLISQPYNHLPDVNGRSEVQLLISDGSTVLQKPVTLIQLRRKDHSREWARFWHLAIPLPYKEQNTFTLVTDTEIALLEKLKQRIPGVSLRYFIPRGSLATNGAEFWSSIRETANKF